MQAHADDQDQDILCYCEWLTRDEIVAAIPHVRDLKQLREVTRACTTCFGCEGDLVRLAVAIIVTVVGIVVAEIFLQEVLPTARNGQPQCESATPF